MESVGKGEGIRSLVSLCTIDSLLVGILLHLANSFAKEYYSLEVGVPVGRGPRSRKPDLHHSGLCVRVGDSLGLLATKG